MEITAGATFSEQYYKDLVLQSPVAIYICDMEGYIQLFNEQATELWGRIPVAGEDLWCGSWKSYYPDGKLMLPEASPAAQALLTGVPAEKEEILIMRPDGTLRNVLVYPRLIYNEEKVLTGACCTLVDVTEYKRDEEKEAMLSAIVTSSDDAIISKNLDGYITSWNNGAQKIFGYTEQEVLGKPINILIPEYLQDEEKRIIGNIRKGNRVDHFHTTRLTKDGREIKVSLTVSPVKDRKGTVIGASKIARDITEQQQKELQRLQGVQRLETLYDLNRLISAKLDVPTILQRVTHAAKETTGAAYGAFFYNVVNEKGESCRLYTFSGAETEDFEQLDMTSNGKAFEAAFKDKRILRIDDIGRDDRYSRYQPLFGQPKGQPPLTSYMAIPVISGSGEVIGGLALGHPAAGVFQEEYEEIAERIMAQGAVALDNSKLFEEIKTISAKKDEFIALASHELKTPLTTIKVCLQILQKTNDANAMKIFLDKSIKQVEKLNMLISDLFDTSKIESGKLQLLVERFDLKQMLLDVIETFQYNRTTHHILFEDHCGEIMVHADRQRIEQAVINLMTNAIKYSPEANEVTISLNTSGKEVIVSVKDKGIGLKEEEQQKIFDRFYRAAGPINVSGLGLGLYLTKEIIERHRGTIGVNSTEGKGSEFYFKLPLE